MEMGAIGFIFKIRKLPTFYLFKADFKFCLSSQMTKEIYLESSHCVPWESLLFPVGGKRPCIGPGSPGNAPLLYRKRGSDR